jgi:hypothetical protein
MMEGMLDVLQGEKKKKKGRGKIGPSFNRTVT